MANVAKYVAALGVAGAMLLPAPASFAQEYLAQPYVPVAYGDCYYGTSATCGSSLVTNAAYGAFAPVPFNAIASNGIVAQPVYAAPTPWRWGRLRGGDWTAIHGANQ